MWSTARMDLGLNETEFWRLTPRKYVALLTRFQEQERRSDLRAGILASLFANANRDSKKHPQPFAPWDFFPSIPKPTEHVQTMEEQMKIMAMWGAVTGGGTVQGKVIKFPPSRQGGRSLKPDGVDADS